MKPTHFLFFALFFVSLYSCKKDDDQTVAASTSQPAAPDISAALRSNVMQEVALVEGHHYGNDLTAALSAVEVHSNARQYALLPTVALNVRQELDRINNDMDDMGFNNFNHSQVRLSENHFYYAAYSGPSNLTKEGIDHCMAVVDPNSPGTGTTIILEGPKVMAMSQTARYLADNGLTASQIHRILFPIEEDVSGASYFSALGTDQSAYQSTDATVSFVFDAATYNYQGTNRMCGIAELIIDGCLMENGVCQETIDLHHKWVVPLD